MAKSVHDYDWQQLIDSKELEKMRVTRAEQVPGAPRAIQPGEKVWKTEKKWRGMPYTR